MIKEDSLLSRIIEISYRYKRKLFPPDAGLFPRQIDVEVTNACNLDCIMCPRSSMTRLVGHMKMDLFEKMIDEVSEFGLDHMDLSLFGEPLINPNIFEMAHLAKTKGKVKHLYTSTNGLLLDEEKSEKLLFCGFDKIILSIDGATKETYEKIRKRGDYEEVIKKTLSLINTRDKKDLVKPYFVIQIIRMKETDSEIGDFIKFWRPHLNSEDKIQIKPYLTWAGKVADRTLEGQNHKIEIRTPCLTYLWRNLAIYQNGDVTTCCYDSNGEMVLGNLKDISIKEIWHSTKLERIRKLHLDGRFDTFNLCRNCYFTRRNFAFSELVKLGIKHLSPLDA